MYLEQLPEYRTSLMSGICRSEEIIDLIRPADQPEMTAASMRYKYIFPYDHTIDTTTEAGTYVCFDIDVPRVQNQTYVDMTICIWIIVHERNMRTANGLLLDRLGIAIEKLMNGSRDFGLGTLELKSFLRTDAPEQFHSRVMVYKTVDFNRL